MGCVCVLAVCPVSLHVGLHCKTAQFVFVYICLRRAPSADMEKMLLALINAAAAPPNAVAGARNGIQSGPAALSAEYADAHLV